MILTPWGSDPLKIPRSPCICCADEVPGAIHLDWCCANERPWLERFWAKVDRSAGPKGCWLWTAGKNAEGYGRFYPYKYVDGKRVSGEQAHRVAYELLVGPIPEGLVIDHLCRVVACVNPAHLEPVTQRINVWRGEAIKSHCLRGHALKGENLYWHSTRSTPECRTCRNARQRAYYARKSAA